MQLITGPPGSGKTKYVLDQLQDAVRRADAGVRLLTPTATLAQHLQNQVARDGFVFRRSVIQTLSRFVEGYAEGAVQVPDAVLYLLVEEAARRVNRPEFARVTGMRGFSASLARAIEELASAGCDSRRLAESFAQVALDAPLGPAFLAVYRELDSEMARRRLVMRGELLRRAAERIERDGAGNIHAVWLDGFHALPDPELRVLRALCDRVDVTVTLTDMEATRPTRDRLVAMGFNEQRLSSRKSTPAIALVKAPGIEREVDEIARRIVEQSRAGRPFREIGIIVRAPEVYAAGLQSTLERFGIPARFYFDQQVEEHAVTRFLCGAVDAMLGGWEHIQTLAVLRLAPRFADSNAMDRFDFAVRRQVPNRGLGPLKALLAPPEGTEPYAANERLIHLIDLLGGIEKWRLFALDPQDWAARFRLLRNIFRHARPEETADHELTLSWRRQAAVLDLFDQALDEAAIALEGSKQIELPMFWRAVKAVLRIKPLRLPDHRRNVVHVMSAHEARQWQLPVVFVCGMVEKQFPRFHPQDPFFSDAVRCRLNSAGIRVRTAADLAVEERGLFESAATRAGMLLVLSYPEFDARGDRNLPSLYLEDLIPVREDSRPVSPQPRAAELPRPIARIQHHDLIAALRARTASLGPTSVERFLQCPFQFFASRTLDLEPPPCRPAERLDFRLQGTIVHDVLAQWWREQRPIEPLFDRIYAEYCEKERVPLGYRMARLRETMLDDIREFIRDERWPRGLFQSRLEEMFTFELNESLTIKGKIDRLDIGPDGRAYIIDYKYSAAQSTRDKLKNDNLLQAPLYFLAAQRFFGVEPAGMFYIGLRGGGLRGGVQYAGWSAPGAPLEGDEIPKQWMERARNRTLDAVEQIRAGIVVPMPADTDQCRYCDFRDACRVETSAGAAAVVGGAR